MDKSVNLVVEVGELQKRIEAVAMPPELKERAVQMTERLSRMAQGEGYSSEYERTATYIDWLINFPWDKRSQDILDLNNARKILDKNHYGISDIKERILEYTAVLKLQKEKNISSDELKLVRAPILCFVGLVGTGKTTIAYSIAEALGRKIARIPIGGMSDPLDLRGQSRIRPDSEPGLVVKALRRVGTKNPVILLDEIDRAADEGRASVMGVLVELLDPEQNSAFRDHFMDFPIDLSEVLFVATCNNTTNISVAVMDRLEPIQMPSYSDEEKIYIGKNFIFQRTLAEIGLDSGRLQVNDDVWPKIVRPLGYDAGIRTLERTINGICRKVAKMIVDGKGTSFTITSENMKDFLPSW